MKPGEPGLTETPSSSSTCSSFSSSHSPSSSSFLLLLPSSFFFCWSSARRRFAERLSLLLLKCSRPASTRVRWTGGAWACSSTRCWWARPRFQATQKRKSLTPSFTTNPSSPAFYPLLPQPSCERAERVFGGKGGGGGGRKKKKKTRETEF